MTIDIDINDYDGGPHWLSLKGKGGLAGIRAKHKAEWEAAHPRKPNPVRPETQVRLERVVARVKKLELARWIKAWNTAINIIDKSELEVRDAIERDLADLAGLSGIKYGEAMRAADKLSVKIKAIREAAIKQAFRYLRGTAEGAAALKLAREQKMTFAARPAGEHMPFVQLMDPEKAEDARRVALAGAAVAAKLGFNPVKMNVTDAGRKFTLNGKEHDEAGHFDRTTGTVTLQTQFATPGFIPELVSHEVMHAKYQAFLDDYKKEYEALQHDPDYHKEDTWVPINPSKITDDMVITRVKRPGDETDQPMIRQPGFMRPDGLLNPPYDQKYPLYQAKTQFDMDTEWGKMAAEDGCTPYSKEWWDAVKNGSAPQESGYHETLAEMASLKQKVQAEQAEHKERVAEMNKLAVERNQPSPWSEQDEKDWQAAGTRMTAPPTAVWHKELNDGKGAFLLKSKPSKDWEKLYKMVNANWKKNHT